MPPLRGRSPASMLPSMRHASSYDDRHSASYDDVPVRQHSSRSGGYSETQSANPDPALAPSVHVPPISPYPGMRRVPARQEISCYPCRQRKNRCDGVLPCGPCIKRNGGADCDFTRFVRRRGKATKASEPTPADDVLSEEVEHSEALMTWPQRERTEEQG